MQERKPVPISQYFPPALNYYTDTAGKIILKEFTKTRFVDAYASMERLEGRCRLLILWRKKYIRSKLEVHSYLLYFNYEGIKEFRTIDASHLGIWGFKKTLNNNFIQLNLEEAAFLVQDAYAQNWRFQTRIPQGQGMGNPLLTLDTSCVDSSQLLYKLFSGNLYPRMLVNVYLDAMRRADRAMQYDLSDESRKTCLGQRDDFILYGAGAMEQNTILQSGIINIKEKDSEVNASAFIIVSTPREEVIKYTYKFILSLNQGKYFISQCREIGQHILSGNDPENPLNYNVFCSSFEVMDTARIRAWLEEQPDLLLAGEWEHGLCYKKIADNKKPWIGYDFSTTVICEFSITDRDFLVYSCQPLNQILMKSFLQQELKGVLKPKKKYHLPVEKLYGAILSREKWEPLSLAADEGSGDSCCQGLLEQYKGHWAFINLSEHDRKKIIDFLRCKARNKFKLAPQAWYFLLENRANQENNCSIPVTEYYLAAKNWLIINTFGGNLEEELADICANFPVQTIIYAEELEWGHSPHSQSFSEQRIWEIYKEIRNIYQEAGIFRKLGFIPELKDLARGRGTLKLAGKNVGFKKTVR